MKTDFNILFAIVICVTASCRAQEAADALPKEYASCCGTEPVELAFDAKRVYVPNVFTPNGDKVNDYFAPFFNETVTDVWGFAIFSAEGDTMLYQKPYFHTKMDIRNYGWDGTRPDGSVYKGRFHYKARIDDRYTNKHILEGWACSIVCGPESRIFRSKEGCYYPSQAIGKGQLDKKLANGEKDCISN